MNELEEIRKRKLEEMQNNYAREDIQSQEVQQQLQQIEAIVKQKLTKEALQRYSNIKAADPGKAAQLSLLLAQFLQSGRTEMIDDNIMKEILIRITPKKREIKITRK